jgi:hypothetical protein
VGSDIPPEMVKWKNYDVLAHWRGCGYCPGLKKRSVPRPPEFRSTCPKISATNHPPDDPGRRRRHRPARAGGSLSVYCRAWLVHGVIPDGTGRMWRKRT